MVGIIITTTVGVTTTITFGGTLAHQSIKKTKSKKTELRICKVSEALEEKDNVFKKDLEAKGSFLT